MSLDRRSDRPLPHFWLSGMDARSGRGRPNNGELDLHRPSEAVLSRCRMASIRSGTQNWIKAGVDHGRTVRRAGRYLSDHLIHPFEIVAALWSRVRLRRTKCSYFVDFETINEEVTQARKDRKGEQRRAMFNVCSKSLEWILRHSRRAETCSWVFRELKSCLDSTRLYPQHVSRAPGFS
jgi:hypothetical protein